MSEVKIYIHVVTPHIAQALLRLIKVKLKQCDNNPKGREGSLRGTQARQRQLNTLLLCKCHWLLAPRCSCPPAWLPQPPASPQTSVHSRTLRPVAPTPPPPSAWPHAFHNSSQVPLVVLIVTDELRVFRGRNGQFSTTETLISLRPNGR